MLASQSPRRKQLFEDLGFPFKQVKIDIDESFPDTLKGGEIPTYLAEKKAMVAAQNVEKNELWITADTVVWINDHVLNKPESEQEAKTMLQEICGSEHSVYTGVCLVTSEKKHVFYEETKVFFNDLSEAEIDYYLKQYKPFDKAGAYGIQEFIGLIGIKQVVGDFYNVVGFPMQRFWRELHLVLATN